MKPKPLFLLLISFVVSCPCLGDEPPAAERESGTSRVDHQGAVHQRAASGWQPEGNTPLGLPDPDLEPGFPVQTPHSGGTYHGGAAVHTTVADIVFDPGLEIVVTALATGSLHAWRADGTTVSGWPNTGTSGAGYPAAGNLGGSGAILEVVAGFWGSQLVAFGPNAAPLPGWPRAAANFVTTPPALGDVDGDGLDEVFLGEEDWMLHGYDADGSVLPGWPRGPFLGGQERHTPALADLDGDGDLEIVTASGSTTPGVYLFAFHHDGSDVAGFPVLFPKGYVDTFPAIGDVDGDLRPEIVVVLQTSSFPWLPVITVVATDGTIERSWEGSSTAPYGTAPALADLDGDTVPEIIVQSDGHLEVWDGFGTALPGWPVSWSFRWLGNSAPVVGDVDGDELPDVVVTTQEAGSSVNGEARAYDRAGNVLPGFPKSLPLGAGAVPALADLDGDGRNEVVITGSFWNGFAGSYDKVWAYDLGGPRHGPVQWGQFGGGPRHAGAFAARIDLRFESRVRLVWTPHAAATAYDVIRGDLGLLRGSSGDFALATLGCAGENVGPTSLDLSQPDPPAGQAQFFLARPVTPLGNGTYDSTGSGQSAPRDAEVQAAPATCL